MPATIDGVGNAGRRARRGRAAVASRSDIDQNVHTCLVRLKRGRPHHEVFVGRSTHSEALGSSGSRPVGLRVGYFLGIRPMAWLEPGSTISRN